MSLYGLISRSEKKIPEGGNTTYDIHATGQQFNTAFNNFNMTFLHIRLFIDT